ncbi:Receptor-type tyrosine-protein phosphatase eta [Bagarius yarrelli]|uniref:protein-tyrosine-phosphatase n=1 Tax=Bagarius yarrelli TaxID=175774 RepID=A0A556TRG5_BAGYA|nr:Receptor-type tyrosine-protein phosphatase eta [Bagarius yarrelli]
MTRYSLRIFLPAALLSLCLLNQVDPAAVPNLSVLNKTTSSVSLSWNEPNGTRNYFIVNWTDGNGSIGSSITSNTSYAVTGLMAGVSYTFTVTAVLLQIIKLQEASNNSNRSKMNVHVCFTVPALVFNFLAPALNKTTSSVFLTWNEPSGNRSFFEIFWTNGNSGSSNNTFNTFYTVTGLISGTRYTFTVTAVAGNTKGAPTEITAFTSASPVLDFNCKGPNRTAEATLNLTWTNPPGNNQGFNISLSQSISDFVPPCYNVCNYILSKNLEYYRMYNVTISTLGCGNISNSSLRMTYRNWEQGETKTYLTVLKFNENKMTRSNMITVVIGNNSDVLENTAYKNGPLSNQEYRRIKKDYTDIPVNNLRSIPVRVEDFEGYYKKQQLDSNCGFAEQYEDLKTVGTAQTKNSALAVENKTKNRYNNVLPYDSSRVKLSIHGSPFDDYINANYISVKCEKYWPPESKLYNNILVTTASEIELEDWTIRDFTIKNVKTAETRNVRQFHFTAWPDHGVPETTEVLINFRHLVREHMDSFSGNAPAVVHCSAGVGRTGTFVALDHLIFQIERESMLDIFGIIYDMRMHRPLMVQTEDQYVFLNQCASDIIKSRMGTNVDLIYQNTAAFSIYENVQQKKVKA